MRRAVLAAAALVVLTLGAAGCSGAETGATPPAAADGESPAGRAGTAPAAPRVGACYRLDVRAALRPTSTRPPVACTTRHTAVTVAVGAVQPVVDGHLLAFDATRVQRQIADRCRRAVDAHVGGSTRKQRLSRVQAVWFTPTPAQAERGALWYRCDLVISADKRAFAALPRRTAGLLGRTGAMDRWGTCGTAAPSSATFRRVLCSATHSWRARAVITLPAGTTYLAKGAGKVADGRCRDIAATLAASSTTLRWAFEWPTRAQWGSGQRYGFCWLPDPGTG